MKRHMKASAMALLVSGCLWALSAGAAAKEKDAAQCTFDCSAKANKTMESCTQGCPMTKDPSKKEATAKCLSRCADKLHASVDSCTSSCPKKQAATLAPGDMPTKAPAPAQTPATPRTP